MRLRMILAICSKQRTAKSSRAVAAVSALSYMLRRYSFVKEAVPKSA